MGCRKSKRNVELDTDPAFSLTNLLAAFACCSTVGMAICDDQLRFLAVNKALASMNGVAPEAHVSRTVGELIGDLSQTVEPMMERVFATGQQVSASLEGKLVTRSEPGHWIEKYFPIRDAHGRVRRIGAIVVELTAHTKLQEKVQTLGVKEQRMLAEELRDSIRQYHFALDLSLENLLRHTSRLDTRGEQFVQAIAALDGRVAAMQELVMAISPYVLSQE